MIKEKIIKEIINKYNKFRSPESHATLLEIKNDKVKVKFEGHFCETCGINDWIIDLIYVAKDFNINLKLEKIIEPNDLFSKENYRIAIFSIDRK